MSREELVHSIGQELLTKTFIGHTIPRSDYKKELECAMVAAYNRGIEDATKAVKLEKASNYGRYSEDPNPEFKPLGLDVVYQDFYGHGDSGYEAVRVDRDSILKLKI